MSDLTSFTREELEREVSRLRQAQHRYRALFDAIDDGFCIIEFFDGPHGPLSDYIHVEANSGYERHTGIPDIIGKTIRALAPMEADGWVELYGAVLRTGEPIRFERYFAAADRHIEVSAARVEPARLRQVSVLFRDIQERRETIEQRVADRITGLMQAEERLRQSQKMEAVGQLTGGLAHDYNNLLAGISGALERMEVRLRQGRADEIGKYMDAAQGAARRAAALTHRLLAFSRRQTLDPRPTDANALVIGMADLVRRTVGPGIRVEAVTAEGLWTARVDPSQLENALLSLCLNARDAMPDGGRITIETANRRLDGETAKSLDISEGQYLLLCVTDTGAGMSPAVIAKAFDPFFTTKPLGQGTGLGLSMIYGFAKQSGGHARIESETGRGTTVCIYLPRHRGDAADDAADGDAEAMAVEAEADEVVLVVDDEPSVRMLVRDVMEELGCTVLEAADSVVGLKILQSDARITLLISDVGLPGGMNGRQMAEAGRQTRANLKVLFITGYAESSAFGGGRLEPGMQVLAKPFAVETLVTRVQDLMME